MTLDLDALEKVAQEAKSRNDQSFGLDDFGDLLIGAGAVLALIADVKRLVIFHDHEKGRADDLEAERDALQAKLDALEAATVEPEWEYQWGEPGENLEAFHPYATYEGARSAMRKESDYESHRVMRRRKAGVWESVGGESS